MWRLFLGFKCVLHARKHLKHDTRFLHRMSSTNTNNKSEMMKLKWLGSCHTFSVYQYKTFSTVTHLIKDITDSIRWSSVGYKRTKAHGVQHSGYELILYQTSLSQEVCLKKNHYIGISLYYGCYQQQEKAFRCTYSVFICPILLKVFTKIKICINNLVKISFLWLTLDKQIPHSNNQ